MKSVCFFSSYDAKNMEERERVNGFFRLHILELKHMKEIRWRCRIFRLKRFTNNKKDSTMIFCANMIPYVHTVSVTAKGFLYITLKLPNEGLT